MPKTNNYHSLSEIAAEVVRKAEGYVKSGQPIPDWLEKQIRALKLIEAEDPNGVYLLVDGLQDEIDALDRAQYINYEPGLAVKKELE